MELRNTFTVPGDPDATFELLLDLDRVATCMPGAVLLDSDGDEYRGRLKLKIGPITAAYEGSVVIDDVDRDARTARLSARGSEVAGQGTAAADVVATVEPADGASAVTVVTTLQIAGKAAQFGRGVLGDVAQRVIDQFARNLEAELTDSGARAGGPAADGAGAGRAPGVPRAAAPAAAADEDAGMDVLSLLAPILRRQALPVVIALVIGLLLGRLGRRGRRADPPPWPPYGWPPPMPPSTYRSEG